jgi:hypothetical protein
MLTGGAQALTSGVDSSSRGVWADLRQFMLGAAVYNDGLPALKPAHEAYAL